MCHVINISERESFYDAMSLLLVNILTSWGYCLGSESGQRSDEVGQVDQVIRLVTNISTPLEITTVCDQDMSFWQNCKTWQMWQTWNVIRKSTALSIDFVYRLMICLYAYLSVASSKMSANHAVKCHTSEYHCYSSFYLALPGIF